MKKTASQNADILISWPLKHRETLVSVSVKADGEELGATAIITDPRSTVVTLIDGVEGAKHTVTITAKTSRKRDLVHSVEVEIEG